MKTPSVDTILAAYASTGHDAPAHVAAWAKDAAEHDRLVLSAPRGHSLTTFLTALVVASIADDPNVRVFYFSANPTEAGDFVIGAKAAVEATAPHLRGQREGGWGQTQFTVQRDQPLRDPTLRARGWRSALTGGRYDLIIVDSVQDDEALSTPEARAQAKTRFDDSIAPMLVEGGRIVVAGPHRHEDDLLAYLAWSEGFALREYPAVTEWPDLARVTYEFERDESGKEVTRAARVPEDARGRSLWPERWPVEKLLAMRRSVGEAAFSREMQCAPLALATNAPPC